LIILAARFNEMYQQPQTCAAASALSKTNAGTGPVKKAFPNDRLRLARWQCTDRS
jgi:hypothetical protein